MGHKKDGIAKMFPDLEQPFVQLAAGNRIERPEWFVEEKHFRLHQQRLRQRQSLLHAAGQLRRIFVLGAGQSDLRQHLPRILERRLAFGAEQARKAIEGVAKKLAERFDMDYGWDGDTLNFSRSGVDGKIALLADKLRVTANLGFLLSAMKGPIEAEIRRVLSEKFD